ncbi:MAG TPA: hypothetical protein PKJ62_01815 [Bacteroidia bacterium]|nr:hypothetical protein [Bacteroidia bacterium]HNS12432.1 hypothetical protein [Bacteroidia bacterium]
MLKINLTSNELELMKKICAIQIDSFKRLLNGEASIDVRLKLAQIHVSETEMNEINQFMIRQYQMIEADPDSLFNTNKEFLQNFRAVLELYEGELSEFKPAVESVSRRLDAALFVMAHLN